MKDQNSHQVNFQSQVILMIAKEKSAHKITNKTKNQEIEDELDWIERNWNEIKS